MNPKRLGGRVVDKNKHEIKYGNLKEISDNDLGKVVGGLEIKLPPPDFMINNLNNISEEKFDFDDEDDEEDHNEHAI